MTPEKNYGSLSRIENLRIENEIKKIKLMFEHGAEFFPPEDQQSLPPEIENIFLCNIDAFQKAHQECGKVTIHDYIGAPEFRQQNMIPDQEIGRALQTVRDVLQSFQISIDHIYEVGEREIYRFITEELIFKEIDDIRVPGMMLCFIYEDFHPNHECDIKDISAEFITSLLSKDNDFYASVILDDDHFKNELRHFCDSFDSFSMTLFRINKVTLTDFKARVNFSIDFRGTLEGSVEVIQFKGDGCLEFKYEDEFWNVCKLVLPS